MVSRYKVCDSKDRKHGVASPRRTENKVATMKPTIEITKLQPKQDEAIIKEWIGSYLRQHLQWWSHKARLHWSEAQIEQHMEQQGLVQRDWEELTNADSKTDSIVLTARNRTTLSE